MATVYACQRCSRLPPPPPIFSIGPPPNILSMEVRCSSRLLSLSSSSIQHKKITSLSSSSTSSVSVTLGIVIALLISTTTILLIKNRMVKRRQGRKEKCDDTMMVTSSSVKFNGHNNNNHHHHQQNWTNFIPLLSDSCSSDHMSSTPPSEYPCGVIEPLLTNDLHHEYEQIKYDDSLHYYCLVYCRQCANYHPTSSSCHRPCYLPLSTNSSCTCHIQNDNRLFEIQPMLITRTEDETEDLNHHHHRPI